MMIDKYFQTQTTFPPRNFQREAIAKLLNQQNILLRAPTGSGKTETAIALNSRITSSEPRNCTPDVSNCNKLSFSSKSTEDNISPLLKSGFQTAFSPASACVKAHECISTISSGGDRFFEGNKLDRFPQELDAPDNFSEGAIG
ncbi:DEAD/DEAH box helicase [Dendronalium phyllosphericum]|nr:DEAD/DEAH box helicase [Dendronalium phyllosphericum]